MKKLLTCMMAFGLALTATCVNANAANSVNPAVEIEKTVTLQDGTLAPQEEFAFTMLPSDLDAGTKLNHLEIKEGLPLGSDTIKIGYTTADDELTKTASFDFSDVVFPNEAAIYRYEVKETAGTTAAVDYDGTSYIVDVYVNNLGEVVRIHHKDAAAENKALIKFSNNYETETLEISKTVTGQFADPNADFTFRLTLNECSTVPAGTVLKAIKTLNDGTTTEIDVIVGTELEFTLKHNEKLAVDNLPEGMTYVATEDAAEGYTTTKTDSDNGVMTNDGATVDFVNDKIDDVLTGISLTVAPYAAAAVAAAAGFLATKKRKSEEE